MDEEKKKILKKIKESLKTCEQNLLERLDEEKNDDNKENVKILEENLTSN